MSKTLTAKAVGRALLPATAFLAAIGLSGSSMAAQKSSEHAYWGKSVAVGRGNARVLVSSDAHGKLASVAVVMTEGALEGLPTTPNKKMSEGEWPYVLPMPSKGPKTGITHVYLDWHSQGHPPPNIYTVPHFDFHFYYVSRAARMKVKFKGKDDPGLKAPEAVLLPADYHFVPDTAVPEMGVHAIDTTSPEFHGKPFTATFIYGYYRGELTFVEPMVTQAFLLSKPDMMGPVKTPMKYSRRGYYPTSYAVKYDAAHKAYMIELSGLRHSTGYVETSSK